MLRLIISLLIILCSCSPITSGKVIRITRASKIYSGEVIDKHYEPEYNTTSHKYDSRTKRYIKKIIHHDAVYSIRLQLTDPIDNLVYNNSISVSHSEYDSLAIGDYREYEFCADYKIDIQGKNKKGKLVYGWVYKNCYDVLNIKIGDYIEQ